MENERGGRRIGKYVYDEVKNSEWNETKWNESRRIELNQIGWSRRTRIETKRTETKRNEIWKLENRKEIKWRSKFIMFAWITQAMI